MALNTNLPPWLENSQTDWLRSAASSGAHAISQGFQAGIQQKRMQQEMALRLKQLEVENEQVTVLNDLRLQQIEDTRNQVLDKEPLASWAKDPSQPLPSFRSLKTYQAANQIAEQYSRSQAGQAWQATQKQFYERFGDLSGDDQATVMDMLRQSKGQVTSDIFKYTAQAYDRRPRETAAITEAREATRLRGEADRLRASDPAKADELARQAALIEAKTLGKNERIVVGTDLAGKPTVEITSGAAAGSGELTTSNQTDVQKSVRVNTDLLNQMGDLRNNLRWEDVGIAGVVGETVLDKLLPQFGYDTIDLKRVENRTKLRMFVESAKRQITLEDRFTEGDVKRVREITPSAGWLDNEKRAKEALGTISSIFARRNLRDRLALGQTLKMDDLTNEEIAAGVGMELWDYDQAFEFLKNNR